MPVEDAGGGLPAPPVWFGDPRPAPGDMPTAVSDLSFHRTDLLGPASLVPDEWMEQSCTLGPVSRCVETLRRFRAAGAEGIVTHGSTPNQNAALADAWRQLVPGRHRRRGDSPACSAGDVGASGFDGGRAATSSG